jgi:capsular exopolysaccharide synthesis family protein
MRTNIQFAGFDKQLRIIAFTSSVAKEGKSTTIVNTALAMAQAQNKVLLVDADLRRPVISRWFGIEPLPGLTEIILGSYRWQDTVRTITDIMLGDMDVDDVMQTPGLDNLHIIPCGHIPPNPAELINSESLTHFFEDIREEYNLVLIDLPPILNAAETAVVSAKADAVIMIYKAGRTARGALRRAKDQLEHVRANITGIVLNELNAEVSPDYTDIDYYRYYGHEEEGSVEERKPVWVSVSAFFRKVCHCTKDQQKIEDERQEDLITETVES